MRILPLACLVIVCATSPALAKDQGKWPKDAVDMTPEATAAVFSGKTVNFNSVKYYFAPDKTMVGVHVTKGKVDGFARGTWAVSGNEFCFHSEWADKDKTKPAYPFDWCNKLRLSGKVVWEQDTKGEDQWHNDISTGLTKKLKKGDSISADANKLAASWGY